MAFTAAEKLSIARILGITPTLLDAHLTSLGVTVTSDVETAVRAELTRWTTEGANFVSVEPKEANFGARIDPGLAQADIRRNIAVLLEYHSQTGPLNMGTLQIG